MVAWGSEASSHRKFYSFVSKVLRGVSFYPQQKFLYEARLGYPERSHVTHKVSTNAIEKGPIMDTFLWSTRGLFVPPRPSIRCPETKLHRGLLGGLIWNRTFGPI